MSTLNAKARKHIAPSNFVFPKDKRYPIHDISHARNALARSSGKPEEAAVKKAVYAKYPSLKPENKLHEVKNMFISRGFFKLDAIKLAEGEVNPPVQILRIGKFNHPKYGEFEITSATLAELKKNFDNRVRGIDISIDYFHDSDKEAAAWFSELYLNTEGTELWAKVEWTPKATQKLSDREIRYFSPDFAFKWEDPESGVTYNNVLFGGGLTNRPFVKDMAAIVASEEKGKVIMNEKELKEFQAKMIKLAEDHEAMKKEHGEMKAKLEEMNEMDEADEDCEDGEDGEEDHDDVEPKDMEHAKKMLKEMKAKLAEYAESHKKMLGEKKKAEEAKELAEKKTAFNLLLTEGKACAAQEKAFLKGDMTEFVKLSQPLNLEGKGSGASEESGDKDDRILKLAEKMCKEDKSLKMVDAISLAQREVK